MLSTWYYVPECGAWSLPYCRVGLVGDVRRSVDAELGWDRGEGDVSLPGDWLVCDPHSHGQCVTHTLVQTFPHPFCSGEGQTTPVMFRSSI